VNRPREGGCKEGDSKKWGLVWEGSKTQRLPLIKSSMEKHEKERKRKSGRIINKII